MVITFLTDFGLEDDFVGTCHGVIARIAPDVRVLDITHGIRPGRVLQGALMLANTLAYMPLGVHLAVVDPRVGGVPRPLALRDGDGRRSSRARRSRWRRAEPASARSRRAPSRTPGKAISCSTRTVIAALRWRSREVPRPRFSASKRAASWCCAWTLPEGPSTIVWSGWAAGPEDKWAGRETAIYLGSCS